MNAQTDITPRMRRILVDWMAEVIEDYDLNQETLHLAVNFVDRYLSLKDLPKTYLQLLGMACLLIASKLEELHPCRIKELIDVCDGAFTVDQVSRSSSSSTEGAWIVNSGRF
jgi:Cyclin, N-terminal domain